MFLSPSINRRKMDDQESDSDSASDIGSYSYEDDEQEEDTPPPFFDMSGVNGFFSLTSDMLDGGESDWNSSSNRNSTDLSSYTADDHGHHNRSDKFMMKTDGLMMADKSTTDQSDARSTRSYDSASSHLKTLRRKGSKFNFNTRRTSSIRKSASNLKRRTVSSFKAMQRSMSMLSLSTSNTNNSRTLQPSSEGRVSSKRKGLMMSMASMRALRPRRKKQKKVVETERHEHGDGGAIIIRCETSGGVVSNGSSDQSTETNNGRVSSPSCYDDSGKTNNTRIQFRTTGWNITSFRRSNSKKKTATENPGTDQTDPSEKTNTNKDKGSEGNDEKYVFFPSIVDNGNTIFSSKSLKINGAVVGDDSDDDLDFVDKPLVVQSSIPKKKSNAVTAVVEDTSKNGGTTTESSTTESDTSSSSSSSSTSIDSSTIDDAFIDDVTDEASSSDGDDNEDENDGLVEYLFGSPVRYFKKIRSSKKRKERPDSTIDKEVTIRTGRTSRPRTRSRSPAAFLRRRTISLPKSKDIAAAGRATRNGETRSRNTRGDGIRGSRGRSSHNSSSHYLVSKKYDNVFRDLFLVDPIYDCVCGEVGSNNN